MEDDFVPGASPKSYDWSSLEAALEFVYGVQGSEQVRTWQKADLLLIVSQTFRGEGWADAAASRLGYSANHVRRLAKVARVFPPDKRKLLLSPGIHMICAATADPDMWLTRAHDELLSVAQLRDAMAAAKDPGPAKDEAKQEADRIIRKVKAFAEKWRGGAFGHVERIKDVAIDLLIGYPSPLIEGAEAKTYA